MYNLLEVRVVARHTASLLLWGTIFLVTATGCWRSDMKGRSIVETEGNAELPTSRACCISKDVVSESQNRSALPAAPSFVTIGEIPDVTLFNQHGEPVHFYTDLVQGKLVVINLIFTTCKGSCPLLGANVAELSRLLRDRSQSDVSLISISVDPSTDTPELLRVWSEKFSPAPSWTMVTGRKPDVDRLLNALKMSTVDKNDHTPYIHFGYVADRRLLRRHGLTSPAEIAELIGELQASRASAISMRSRPAEGVAIGEDSR